MRRRSADEALECCLLRVRGRVQGVGYRDACVRRARALGIAGWVRNRMDDPVEVLLQGSPRQLAEMCEWLRDGMPAALVEDLEVTPMQPPFRRFDDFVRLPTLWRQASTRRSMQPVDFEGHLQAWHFRMHCIAVLGLDSWKVDARMTPAGSRIVEERLDSPLRVVLPKAE